MRNIVQTGASPNPSARPGGTLNVVFHGMFAYVIWGDHLEVLAPQEEDHVYKAGGWGRERRLKEGGAYELRGVTGAPNIAVDPTENLVLSEFRNIERGADILFFSLRLPIPLRMTGARRVTVDPSRRLFGGAASEGLPVRTLPLLQVLTYSVADFANVSLSTSTAWTPAPSADGIANLHVWAESDSVFSEHERDHPIRGFQQLVRLFPGLDLELLYSMGAPPDPVVQIPGLETWEQATLRERSQLLYAPPAPPEAEASRGAEITNCLSLVVINHA